MVTPGPYFNIPNNEQSHRDLYNLHCGGYIHPTVRFLGPVSLGRNIVIEEDVVVGANCFFGHNAVVRKNVILGDESEVRVNGWVANNAIIGHHTVIYNFANVAAYTIIGNFVYFGVYSMTTNADDIVLHRNRPFIPKPCYISDGARIASRVTINPGCTIGPNALIGSASLVTRDVPGYQKWFGHPATYRGDIDPDDVPEGFNE